MMLVLLYKSAVCKRNDIAIITIVVCSETKWRIRLMSLILQAIFQESSSIGYSQVRILALCTEAATWSKGHDRKSYRDTT